jgi:hypothetical protein
LENLSRIEDEENKTPQSQTFIITQGESCPEASDPVAITLIPTNNAPVLPNRFKNIFPG